MILEKVMIHSDPITAYTSKRVCKTWYKMLNEEKYWKKISSNYFGIFELPEHFENWSFFCVWNHLVETLSPNENNAKFVEYCILNGHQKMFSRVVNAPSLREKVIKILEINSIKFVNMANFHKRKLILQEMKIILGSKKSCKNFYFQIYFV